MAEENGAGGVYVLQVFDSSGEAGGPWWKDMATVTVPARTKRKTAIRAALKEAGLNPSEEIKVRLLDAESAEPRTVRPKPATEPELEIV